MLSVRRSQAPSSCDTFVVLPPLTRNGLVIFGKNSDRPQNEVQEVVYANGGEQEPRLKCTYITIDGSRVPINATILSKPAWMWGAEMGANDKGVVIGNEAVWTKNNEGSSDARTRRLLGMDLVRLGLERGHSAEDALTVITSLLEEYGQGGSCSEKDDSLFYHNSFLIADAREAWVLETSGKLWAAERITSGYRNISNGLTIGTKFDKASKWLVDKAKVMKYWDGEGEFDFTKCFSSGGDEQRQRAGEELLMSRTTSPFDVEDMFDILRHKESRICRGCDDAFPTQASQVSSLSSNGLNIHWFTATPDTSLSYFKPFIFTPDAIISPYTVSPEEPKREHLLYKLHAEYCAKVGNEKMMQDIRELENSCLTDLNEFVRKLHLGKVPLRDAEDVMMLAVDAELEMYGQMCFS